MLLNKDLHVRNGLSGYNAVVDAIHLFGTTIRSDSVFLSPDAGQVHCPRIRYMVGNLLDLIWGTLVEGLPLGLRLLFGASQLGRISRHVSLSPHRPGLVRLEAFI